MTRSPTSTSQWHKQSLAWQILLALGMLLLSASFVGTVGAEMQASWTPNEDEGPAMPLSMNQRQQLLQLQQAIQNSPDPNGTLQQVAQSNNMSPNDLYQMIEKNARDLQQDPALLNELQQYAQSAGSQMGRTLPKLLLNMVAALGVSIRQTAQSNPRAFYTTVMIFFCVMYTLLAIPRTGLHISSSRNLLTLSRGPTTVFSPPDRYLHKIVGKMDARSPRLSIQTLKKEWDDLLKPMIRELAVDGLTEDDNNDDDIHGRVETHKLGRKHELKQAVTAQFVLGPEKLLKAFPLGETVEEIEAERENIVDLLYTNAAGLLTERNLIEFSPGSTQAKSRLKAICGDGKKSSETSVSSRDFGVIAMKGLGNLGRYGLIQWKVTSETSNKSTPSASSQTLTLTTLKGKGFFDGQIHISVRKLPDHDGLLVVQVSLAVPKGGRKLNQKVAQTLVEEMGQSLVQSAFRRTKQRLARQSQGKRFKDIGNRRATERRNTRNERDRLLEEMAADRRRRWQKQNPDAGRYRPSGHRMRSPNNSVWK